MATAAEQKRRDEAAQAKADAAKNDKDQPSPEEIKEASEERPQHVGSDSNVDKGTADPSNGIAQPTVDRDGPDLSVATDSLGTDRIVPAGVQDGWQPAPVEPDEDAVKKAKERVEKQEEQAEARREGRVDPVSGKLLSKDEHAKAEKARKDAEKDSDK